MPSPLFSIWFILLSPFFTASLQFFSHNWENENFCVKWGLNEDHFSSLVLMRTKSSIEDLSARTEYQWCPSRRGVWQCFWHFLGTLGCFVGFLPVRRIFGLEMTPNLKRKKCILFSFRRTFAVSQSLLMYPNSILKTPKVKKCPGLARVSQIPKNWPTFSHIWGRNFGFISSGKVSKRSFELFSLHLGPVLNKTFKFLTTNHIEVKLEDFQNVASF